MPTINLKCYLKLHTYKFIICLNKTRGRFQILERRLGVLLARQLSQRNLFSIPLFLHLSIIKWSMFKGHQGCLAHHIVFFGHKWFDLNVIAGNVTMLMTQTQIQSNFIVNCNCWTFLLVIVTTLPVLTRTMFLIAEESKAIDHK